jgi:hypothetical protein
MKSFLYRLATVLFLMVSAAEAILLGGIKLPPVRDDLALQGAGLLRKGLFFKIYAGALYTAEPVKPKEILSDIPKRIDINISLTSPKNT